MANDPGERAVEVPIVLRFLAVRDDDVLEVGNVLGNWIPIKHKVIDKYEAFPGIDNVDIVDFVSDSKFKWVVCISTIEHIGKDGREERDPNKPLAAYNNMKSLLSPGGMMVVTWPVGYNLDLDKQFDAGLFDFSYVDYMKRVEADRWTQCEWRDIKGMPYGTPFHAGNGLVIAYYAAFE